MRNTLTLDDDLAAFLEEESRRAGRSFRDLANEALREGLSQRRRTATRPVPEPQAFKVTARDLGNLQPGLSLDHISELIEQVEGPLHR